MLKLGQINELEVLRKVDFGYFLDGFEYGDILMPAKYAADGLEIGDHVNVFVYLDSSEKLVATSEQPKAFVGQFAFLTVMRVNEVGAFLDWGVTKQLFVPFAEQKVKMEEGKSYLVYIFIDPVTERIQGSSKIDRFLDLMPPLFKQDEVYDGLVMKKTDLGYKIIIDHSHTGLLFFSEVHKEMKTGDKISVLVKQVRPDGKIDLTTPYSPVEKTDEVSNIIIKALQENKGFLPLSDHSDPELIKQTLGLSKKLFKKGIGKLYKERQITIEENGIYLLLDE